MLVLGGAADSLEKSRLRYDEIIASGAALDKMRQIVEAQHGDPRAVDDHSLLPRARGELAVKAPSSGYVQSIDTESIGRASMMLGAGRVRLDTPIDLSVGLMLNARIGDRVEEGSTLTTLCFNDPALADEAALAVAQAYVIGGDRVEPPCLIKAVLR
jgi:thymidine phosphorylase